MVSHRTKKLLGNTMWFAVGNFGSQILSFLLVPLYTNYLVPKEFGKIDLMITTINLLVYICTLSISDAVFRFALDKNEDKEEVFNGGLSIILLSGIGIGAVYFIAMRLSFDFGENWLYFLILYFCISLMGFLVMFLQALQKTRTFAMQGILYTFSLSVLNVFLLMKLKLGIHGYFISMIGAYVISIMFVFLKEKLYKILNFIKIKKKTIVKMVKYSIPLIPASVAWWIIASMDRYMIVYMYNERANGLYAVAQKIPAIIAVLTSFFIKAWQISAIKIKEDRDSSEYFLNLYKVLTLLGFTFSFVLVLVSKIISKFLFVKEFFCAWTMVPCLIASTLFSAIALFMGAQFTAYKKSSLHLISNSLAMFFNFIFNYIFLKIMGPIGATVATMLSFFIVLTYRQIKVSQLMYFNYDKLNYYYNSCLLMLVCILMAFDISHWEKYGIGLFIIFIILNYKNYKLFVLKLMDIKNNYKKGEKEND